ncbi:unnamed protein product [Pleuronectes platessa]|uniref:Uncharacterized protein n=1 Tax=Pleuronectes platessa TaxID=8262 RepID=A0A9N7U4Y8_PLEPL|nr:unnamed protein product [Pleuronectes platessa]
MKALPWYFGSPSEDLRKRTVADRISALPFCRQLLELTALVETWKPCPGWDSTRRCAISAPVQFGTGCMSRNLAPSLHLSHSNYNLLKSCYPTPHSDNDSASS